MFYQNSPPGFISPKLLLFQPQPFMAIYPLQTHTSPSVELHKHFHFIFETQNSTRLDHSPSWSNHSPATSYQPVGIVADPTHLHFIFKSQNFAKLAQGQSRAFQLSISEDSAFRIVLPSAEVARFSHIHPATHHVSHVPPYKVYAKLSHRPQPVLCSCQYRTLPL